jgi:hypothetical protein
VVKGLDAFYFDEVCIHERLLKKAAKTTPREMWARSRTGRVLCNGSLTWDGSSWDGSSWDGSR